jgi:hypothetical protein
MATAAKPDLQTTRAPRHLLATEQLFRRNFNETSFAFQHSLANHPLFRLERLMELAKATEQTRPRDLYYDAGDVAVNQRWDQTPRPQFAASDAIKRIENSGAWIVLKHAEKDPAYKVVLDECMKELEALTGLSIAKVMKIQEVIMFITSPRRVTTYHIDRECSILLQIQGDKKISIFHRDDREVLPERDIERFWSVDNNAPRYNPVFEDRAKVYQLTPGSAVHIPVNFPHWLQNSENISVSLNINFQYRDSMRANVYRANFLLRKLGLNPTPPFRSTALDRMKCAAVTPVVWAGNISKGRKPWS